MMVMMMMTMMAMMTTTNAVVGEVLAKVSKKMVQKTGNGQFCSGNFYTEQYCKFLPIKT